MLVILILYLIIIFFGNNEFYDYNEDIYNNDVDIENTYDVIVIHNYNIFYY